MRLRDEHAILPGMIVQVASAANRSDASTPHDGDVEVSIVLPCLNEAITLPVCIRKAAAAIERHGLRAEIIVADNGSTDGSQEIARGLGARVIDVETRGYGAALAAGFRAAAGTYIVMADADDSYDLGAFYPFIERLRAGDELVMGCRLPAGGGTIMPGAMPLKNRVLGNPVLSWLGRTLFRSTITDFHCGLRAFRRDSVLALDLRTTGMEFASEMVIKAVLAKLAVSEIPITLYPDGRQRRPHLRPWRDGWRHLRFMMLMSPRWLFLWPGLLLALIGGVASAWLLPRTRFVFGLGLDTTTLLVATMVFLLGFQVCVYAIFARIFAISEGLLRPDPLLTKLSRYFSLEGGVVCGLLLIIGGIGLLAYAVWVWGQFGFGHVDAGRVQRLAIPGVTATILGIQIVFSSLFIGVLSLGRR
ncbi:MAG: glycosyltransferase family 2 protein [Thermoanaerobaculia bacterium]